MAHAQEIEDGLTAVVLLRIPRMTPDRTRLTAGAVVTALRHAIRRSALRSIFNLFAVHRR